MFWWGKGDTAGWRALNELAKTTEGTVWGGNSQFLWTQRFMKKKSIKWLNWYLLLFSTLPFIEPLLIHYLNWSSQNPLSSEYFFLFAAWGNRGPEKRSLIHWQRSYVYHGFTSYFTWLWLSPCPALEDREGKGESLVYVIDPCLSISANSSPLCGSHNSILTAQ